MTSPNFFDIFQLQPKSPRSPSIFFFTKGQFIPVSHTSPNFSVVSCLFLTSPNFFGRCHEKVGRSHNLLGEVIIFSMTESALTFFWHTSPNFFGRSMFVFWLLPTVLGEVHFFYILLPTFLGEACFFFDVSQIFWEM